MPQSQSGDSQRKYDRTTFLSDNVVGQKVLQNLDVDDFTQLNHQLSTRQFAACAPAAARFITAIVANGKASLSLRASMAVKILDFVATESRIQREQERKRPAVNVLRDALAMRAQVAIPGTITDVQPSNAVQHAQITINNEA